MSTCNHAVAKTNAGLWRALDFVDICYSNPDGEGPRSHELRRCTCGSTLSVPLERADDFAAEQREAVTTAIASTRTAYGELPRAETITAHGNARHGQSRSVATGKTAGRLVEIVKQAAKEDK